VKKVMIITCQLYFTVLTVSSEIKSERENYGCSQTIKLGGLGARNAKNENTVRTPFQTFHGSS
jgi:hypothetical protein